MSQFRNKLKTTKDKLKETETELASAREAGPPAAKKAAPKASAAAASKPNPKKRPAAQIDADASTLGTPGDGPAAKKSRKAAAGVGDKSTFSITPFLNKTASVIQEEEEPGSDAEASPAAKKTKQPLAQQPASKANVPPKKAAAARKPKPMLEMVTEEDEHEAGQENAGAKAQTLKIKTKTGDGPDETANKDKNKKKPKIRKSLADFTSFNPEPEVEKKKKRKLGSLGKTLFDEGSWRRSRSTCSTGSVWDQGLRAARGRKEGWRGKLFSSEQ